MGSEKSDLVHFCGRAQIGYESPMASTIHMVKTHNLGKEKALEAAVKVAERLKEKAEIAYTIEGDRIEVKRTGAKGRIVVRETEVEAEVELGMMLRPMKGMIESKMAEYFDKYLASLQQDQG